MAKIAVPDHFHSLDILRTIAVTQVVFAHGAMAYLSQSASDVVRGVGSLLITLNFGVHLFFILSGFLMIHQLERNDELPRFFRNRAAKIYPTYLLTILLAVATAPAAPGDVAAHLLGIHNWFPAYGFSLFPHLWSLAVELQFYLFVPFFFRYAYARYHSPHIIVWMLLVFLVSQGYTVLNGLTGQAEGAKAVANVYGHTLTNISCLLLGVLLYKQYRSGFGGSDKRRNLRQTGVGLAASLALVTGIAAAYVPGHDVYRANLTDPREAIFIDAMIVLWQLAPYFLARLVIVGGPGPNRLCTFVAGISYQWYLLHVPVVLLLMPRLGIENIYGNFLIYTTITLGVAWISTKFLELPLLRLVRKISL